MSLKALKGVDFSLFREHGFDVVTGRQFAGSPVEEAKRTGRKAFPIQDPDTAQVHSPNPYLG